MCGRTSDDRGGLRAAVKEYNRGEWYTVNFEGGGGGDFLQRRSGKARFSRDFYLSVSQ